MKINLSKSGIGPLVLWAVLIIAPIITLACYLVLVMEIDNLVQIMAVGTPFTVMWFYMLAPLFDIAREAAQGIFSEEVQ